MPILYFSFSYLPILANIFQGYEAPGKVYLLVMEEWPGPL